MSIIVLMTRVDVLEKTVEKMEVRLEKQQREFDSMIVQLHATFENATSLAVSRAIQRPPITIPPVPKCLHEIGMV